jgi:hypothetical protein
VNSFNSNVHSLKFSAHSFNSTMRSLKSLTHSLKVDIISFKPIVHSLKSPKPSSDLHHYSLKSLFKRQLQLLRVFPICAIPLSVISSAIPGSP